MWLHIVIVFVLLSFFHHYTASEQLIHMETSSTLSLLQTDCSGTAYRLMRAPASVFEESSLISFLRLRGQFWRFMFPFCCFVISLTLSYHWRVPHHTRAFHTVPVLLCTATVISGICSQVCVLVMRLFLLDIRAYFFYSVPTRIGSLNFTRSALLIKNTS